MLAAEAAVEEGAWVRAGLAAALEEIASSAFIVDGAGQVKHANAVGRDRMDRHPAETVKALRAAAAGQASDEFRVTEIAGAGLRVHWLVVATGRPGVEGRLACAVIRWRLTTRQGEVLGLLVLGEANKTIAVRLECAVRTVEQHVTVILGRAGVETRAALAAQFWKA